MASWEKGGGKLLRQNRYDGVLVWKSVAYNFSVNSCISCFVLSEDYCIFVVKF